MAYSLPVVKTDRPGRQFWDPVHQVGGQDANQLRAAIIDLDLRAAILEAGQGGGAVGYGTKAAMDADLAHADGSIAFVLSDATVTNNGMYRKSGASGAGSWVAAIGRVDGWSVLATGSITARSLAAWFGDVANVIAFGADPTGSVDSSPAVQAAVNTGKRVFFPAGIYLVNNVLLPSSGITLEGANPYTTIIKNTHATNHTFYTSSAAGGSNLWVFARHLTIQMATNGQSGDGVHLSNVSTACLEGVNVTTPPGLQTTGNGIYSERTDATATGYYLTIRKCFVEKQGRGIYLKGGSGYNMNVETIDDSVVNNNTNEGIRLEYTTRARVMKCSLEQNLHNVYVSHSSGAVVADCYMERPATHDVVLDASQSSVIRHNYLSSAGNVNTATGRSVIVLSGSQFNEITDNACIDTWSSYDIEIQAGALQTIVARNIGRDRVSGWGQSRPMISDAGTQTVTDKLYLTAGGSMYRELAAQVLQLDGPTLKDAQLYQDNGGGTPPQIMSGSNNPASSAIAAPAGSLYARASGTNGLYVHPSTTASDWRQVQMYYPSVQQAWTPGAVAAGATTSTTVTVPGAAMGDFVTVSFNLASGAMILYAEVSSANTVTVRWYNPTAGTVTLGAGTLTVRVSQM